MEMEALLRRAEDLLLRCERSGTPVAGTFLSPAEQAALAQHFKYRPGCRLVFFGGQPDSERSVPFFLPDWMEEADFDPSQSLRALKITAYYGTPGHRDYLGALLARGVRREWVGDLLIDGQTAWVFCLPSVAEELAGLEQVGRVSVKAETVPVGSVPAPDTRRKPISFTVQSPRLDAVLSETFRLSRTAAVRQIAAGFANLNHLPCLKPDAPVHEGDVLSLKGYGKARIAEIGGVSRKGRTYVKAEIYL